MTAAEFPTPDGSGGPHVLVEDVASPEVGDDDLHHLRRVLRLPPDAELTVTDGVGHWRNCRLTADGVTPAGDMVFCPRRQPLLTVAFAVTKGARPELVVQKLTELGLDSIAIFEADRSVARWDEDKWGKARVRLERVAREALMQSRGVWMPEVAVGMSFEQVAAMPGAAMADRGAGPLDASRTTVLVGPEGGWSATESAGVAEKVGLGPNLLRAETAAIAAGVLLTARRSAALI